MKSASVCQAKLWLGVRASVARLLRSLLGVVLGREASSFRGSEPPWCSDSDEGRAEGESPDSRFLIDRRRRKDDDGLSEPVFVERGGEGFSKLLELDFLRRPLLDSTILLPSLDLESSPLLRRFRFSLPA